MSHNLQFVSPNQPPLSLLPTEDIQLEFSEESDGDVGAPDDHGDGRSFIRIPQTDRTAKRSSKSKHSKPRSSQSQTSRSKNKDLRAPDSDSDDSDSEQRGRIALSDRSNLGTLGTMPRKLRTSNDGKKTVPEQATKPPQTKRQYEAEISALKAQLETKNAEIKTSTSELAQSDKKKGSNWRSNSRRRRRRMDPLWCLMMG